MSFFGALFGTDAKKAANKAAKDQYKKETAAVGDYQNQMLGLSKAFDPYSDAGQSALERLLGGLGLGTAAQGQAFTDAYHNLPGYQAGMDRGINAVNSTANARGMLNSGATDKALYRFGSDYENSRAGDYLSRLAGVVAGGQSALGAGVNTAAQGYGGAFGGRLNSAKTIGQGMVAGANAESAALGNLLGVVGSGIGAAFGSPWLGTALGYGTNLNSILPGGKPSGQGGIGHA